MPSPLVLVSVNGGPFNPTGANGLDVSPAGSVAITLQSPAGVSSWYLQVGLTTNPPVVPPVVIPGTGTDETQVSPPALTGVNGAGLVTGGPTATVSFTFPGAGTALLFSSTVVGIFGSITSTFCLFARTGGGFRVGPAGLTREGSTAYGWAALVNPALRNSSGGRVLAGSRYVATDGDDLTGDGSLFKPFATYTKAAADAITGGAGPGAIFVVIYGPGVFPDNVALVPWVGIVGNSLDTTLGGIISYDSTFTGVGELASFIENIGISGDVTLNAASNGFSGQGGITFIDVFFDAAITITYTGVGPLGTQNGPTFMRGMINSTLHLIDCGCEISSMPLFADIYMTAPSHGCDLNWLDGSAYAMTLDASGGHPVVARLNGVAVAADPSVVGSGQLTLIGAQAAYAATFEGIPPIVNLSGDAPAPVRLTGGLQPQFSQIVHVAKGGNDTYGDGSLDNPFQTIQAAYNHIPDAVGFVKPYTIYVAPGVYSDNFAMKSGVTIAGRDLLGVFITATSITYDGSYTAGDYAIFENVVLANDPNLTGSATTHNPGFHNCITQSGLTIHGAQSLALLNVVEAGAGATVTDVTSVASRTCSFEGGLITFTATTVSGTWDANADRYIFGVRVNATGAFTALFSVDGDVEGPVTLNGTNARWEGTLTAGGTSRVLTGGAIDSQFVLNGGSYATAGQVPTADGAGHVVWMDGGSGGTTYSEIVLVAQVGSTSLSTLQVMGGRSIDMSNYPATIGSLNRTMTFVATIEKTAGATSVGVQLYDVTDAVIVSGTSLTSSSNVPVDVSGVLTVGTSAGDIRTDHVAQYEVQIQMNGGSPTLDRAVCTNARIVVTYS